jgi:hypothetical protein
VKTGRADWHQSGIDASGDLDHLVMAIHQTSSKTQAGAYVVLFKARVLLKNIGLTVSGTKEFKDRLDSNAFAP